MEFGYFLHCYGRYEESPGKFLKDTVITRAEIRGLMRGLVASEEEPLGTIKFSEWISEKGTEIGRHYHNDLKERRYSR